MVGALECMSVLCEIFLTCLQDDPVMYCCITDYQKTQWLKTAATLLYLTIMWVRNQSKTQLAKMTLLLVSTKIIWGHSTGRWAGLESLKQLFLCPARRQDDWKAGLGWGCQPECLQVALPGLQSHGNGLRWKLRTPRGCAKIPRQMLQPYDLTSEVLEHHFCHM